MWTDPMWIADVKEDGDRRMAQFAAAKLGVVKGYFTGTPSKKTGEPVEKTDNLPHLSIGPPSGMNGTILDGEIIAPWASDLPGGKSKYVTSIMGSSPAEAIRKQQELGWLRFVVFDCIQYKGRLLINMPLRVRRQNMRQAVAEWANPHVQEVAWRAGAAKRAFYDGIVENGGEGVVLKHIEHLYGDAKLWVKVKKRATADVIVMGYEPGKGKYKGIVGSIVFGQYVKTPGTRTYKLTALGACSGITDELRYNLSRAPQQHLGQVMEISFIEREPTGAFRSPQFSRWRDDKSATPENCQYRPEET